MTFRSLPVFDFAPNFDDPEAGQLDDFAFESRGYGVSTPWRPSGATRRTVKLPVLLNGLTEIGRLRRFCDSVGGRQRPCWLPAWTNDFGLQADSVAGATSITVDGHEFSARYALGGQYVFIALLTGAGKLECYGVTAVDSSGTDDVLTLDRGLDSDLDASETVCCPLLLARLADDALEFDYIAGDTISGEMQFVECPTEYPGTASSSSGADSIHMGARPVWLYRITDGTTTLHLADYGVDVTAASQTWTAADIQHGGLSSSWDMLGDDVQVTLRTDDPNHALLAYLDERNLADFTLEIFAADMDSLASLDLTAPDHIGRLESVEFGTDGDITLQVSSLFRLNEREIPTMRMQRTCNWRTFEGGCQAVEADFTTSGTISAISADPAYVEATAFGDKATAESDANWFALGKVTVGSETRLCTGQLGNRLYLNFPLKSAAVGDSISAVAGDDKRVGTCDSKFNQLANHCAAPYMPNDNPQFEPMKTPASGGGKK